VSAVDDQRLSDSIRLYDNCNSRRGPVFIGCGAIDHLARYDNHFQKPMRSRSCRNERRREGMKTNHEEAKGAKIIFCSFFVSSWLIFRGAFMSRCAALKE
jgi:hypothetical protein